MFSFQRCLDECGLFHACRPNNGMINIGIHCVQKYLYQTLYISFPIITINKLSNISESAEDLIYIHIYITISNIYIIIMYS